MAFAPKIWKIGVTGGIGCGKSNILKVIQTKFHVPVIDADKLGHSVYEVGSPGYAKVVKTFGPSVVEKDGQINRRKLGEYVFGENNKANMKKLTDIVWPEIGTLAQTKMKQLELQGEPVVVVEGAVIVEMGWYTFLDELWVVIVPVEVAKARIMERNQLSAEEALRRINSQISNDERTKHANFVISTDRPIEQTNEVITSKFSSILEQIKKRKEGAKM